ncbi:NUDIX hydrolase [Streptococcus suis]|nr:NUDIX hydrolase [Streptococcus suis]NQM14006.1 NUDIX domain-containing protein [Streptococcus suis]
MVVVEQALDFIGSKVALLCDDKVLTILRDDKPTIPYPKHWDLPGGGRENGETAFECLQREIVEELGIRIDETAILWQKAYPSVTKPTKQSVFMVGRIRQEQVDEIVFGDEGQGYQMMTVSEFLEHEQVIPQLQARLRDYIQERVDGKTTVDQT